MGWIYNGEEFVGDDLDPKKIYGFVYEIRNLLNGRKYIGKKFFWSMRTKVVKGKKKKLVVQSDWKKYWGSNGTLLADIEKDGESNFEREIKFLCESKSVCAYLEAREQFNINAILDPVYYNDWIQVKITRRHLQKYSEKYS
jgi:hypothetical protein